LVDVDLAVEEEAASAFVDNRFGLDVVLVADLADDLLEQILDRHEPRGPAVFVDHDRALRLLALELLQQLGDALGFRHDDRRAHQRRDPHVAASVMPATRKADEVPDEYEALDVVESPL